ncbi:HlyD family type I secretion periplasmic adaptor subunit [Desulfopila sp. IMCC35008]|uniref:HlyD family type I secretion periplasmic adaptor subunit n=1 Tax=Desulfopila sp. IMCC35008 TaxID=2653858 RepID=UPI0013D23406|nr:HlyD family type I secretion periplasmic adaptor subunit [Desulfopila sp. IMCC35008]
MLNLRSGNRKKAEPVEQGETDEGKDRLQVFKKVVEKTGAREKYLEYRRQREARLDYEFMPATLEVLERPPAPFSRVMLISIVVLTAFAVGWASLARMDIVVSGSGVVRPKGKVKVIQPLEPGIVTAIHVRDGQIVKKGESLISMDNTDSLADIKTVRKEVATAELKIKRLQAELHRDPGMFHVQADFDNQNLQLHRRLLEKSINAQDERLVTLEREIERCLAERDSIQSNLERLTMSLPLSKELFNKKKVLAQKKLISNAELLQAKIEMNDLKHNLLTAESSLTEVEARLAKAREEKELANSEYHRDILRQLTDAKNEKAQLHHQLAKAENQQTHFELKAPIDGIVQQLSVNTIGGVVTAAQPLMVIVPTDCDLEIEAKVLDKDIGFISEKQEVSVKVTAYPYTRHGDIKGRIEWVARDAVVDEKVGPSYPIRVAVNQYYLPNVINGRQGVIAPGMTVTTDVKVGRRRVIEYFLGPIMRYKDESLREI